MAIKCDEYNGVCVFSVDGDLAGDAGAAFRRNAEEKLLQKRAHDYVVDLEKADFVDSDGLEALVWLKRRSDDLFGRMCIASADVNVQKILEMTRLNHRFESHTDLAAALKSLR